MANEPVLEVALIDVTDAEAFAAAYRQAREVLTGTPGCRSVRMTHGVESPQRFVLLVEWDSVEAHEAVWLPREDQLRALLGTSFVGLERVPGPPEGYAVTTTRGRHLDVTPEAAYARAVLAAL